MTKRIVFPIIIALLVSCHTEIIKPEKLTREAFLQALNNEERRNSPIEWTSATAFATDAELMLLLETLYRHVREDSFPDKIKTKEKWMNNYGKKLATYYDSHKLGSNTIATYAKADSVLKKGMWLLLLDCHWSTIEMIINSSAELTFDTYREYGLLNQITRCCKNEREKGLFYREWDLYRQVYKTIETIGSNIVLLDCWGGSMSGPATTGFCLELMQSRRDMYERISDILNSNLQDNTQSNRINAEKNLLSHYHSSFKKAVDKANIMKFPMTTIAI